MIRKMPFSTVKKDGKEYVYYVASASKRLYIGTPGKPNKDNVIKALDLLKKRRDNCIEKFEEEENKLISLLPAKTNETVNKPIFYELVVFDLDGVLYQKPWYEIDDDQVAVSTWDILFQELGPTMYEMHNQLKDNYKKGLYGIGNYLEWTRKACKVLESCLTKKIFEEVINKRQLMSGAKELFEELHKNNVKIAVISGSFEALAQRAAKELGGIDDIKAHCKLNFDSKGLLDSNKLEKTDYNDKAIEVLELMKKYGFSKEKCAYIGDDVNDLPVFKEVGLAIAFNCKKPQVQEIAHVVLKSQDLRDIIPHLKFGPKK